MGTEAEMLKKRLIHKHFNNASQGFFIGVGANDPKKSSQTWQLEQAGWNIYLFSIDVKILKNIVI